VFANQYHRLWRVAGQVDVIVTDSPIFLSAVYGETTANFKALVVETFKSYENMTYFLRRMKEYNPVGRSQTEDEARAIDQMTIDVMEKWGIGYSSLDGDRSAVATIVDHIKMRRKWITEGIACT
jgi:hypothetical protein